MTKATRREEPTGGNEFRSDEPARRAPRGGRSDRPARAAGRSTTSGSSSSPGPSSRSPRGLRPEVETALSGAGWEAPARSRCRRATSSSATSRALELRADGRRPLADPHDRRPRVRARLARSRILCVATAGRLGRPRRGRVRRSRPTATPRSSSAGSAATRPRMVRPPTHLRAPLATPARRRPGLSLTGASGMWSRLQHRQPRRDDAVRALLLAGDAGDPRARLRLARRRRSSADADDPRPGLLGRRALPG